DRRARESEHPVITRAAVPRARAHIASPCVTSSSAFADGDRTVSSVVNRKSADEFPDLLAHRGFGERIFLDALLREDVEHLDDQLAHLLELGDAEAAGGAGGGAEAYPRRHRGLLRIERDAVLVA